MRIAALALLAVLAPMGEGEDPFWRAEELALLDRGLFLINATRADLGFQKRPIDDPFRLEVVNRALDDPLSIGREAQAWDDRAREGSLEGLLAHATRQLVRPSAMDPPPRMPREDVPELRLSPEAAYAARRLQSFVLSGAPEAPGVLSRMLLSQVEKPSKPVDAPAMEDDEFLRLAVGIKLDGMFVLADVVRAHAERLIAALREHDAGREGFSGRTEFEEIVVYGYGDDVHDAVKDEDMGVVIDLGGNDTWTRGASASELRNRSVSVCIDLAGNDRYVGREDLSFGAALGGIAIQWDCAGDDLYDAGHASLGAGICGVGVLVDEAGDDIYRCRDFGIGAGAFGIGIFLDRSGNDLYHADLKGQGFASTRGVGVLADLDGHDSYDAGGVHVHAPLYTDRTQSLSQGFSIGMRPDASGGVGVLIDRKGNDRYSADIYGQGAAYWFGLGLLVDSDGNDTYNLGQYGQGSGIHLAAGMLLDRAGSDLYYLKNGVGMGGAHDYAVGLLVDRGGDDYYAGSGGTQGGALTNSVALLFDMGGNDGYAAVQEGSQGYAAPARGTGGIGLLLDAGGKDVHTARDRDGTSWTKELMGAGLDEPSPPAEGGVGDPGTTAMTPEAARAIVDRDGTVPGPDGKPVDDLDRLWRMASEWEVGDQRVIVPIARERLVALGTPALDRALERIGDRHGLEFRACESVFAKFPAETVIARLVERSKDADLWVRRRSVQSLATLKAEGAMDRFLEMLEKDPETRGTVLGALAALKKAPPPVKGFLRSPKETEGVQAVSCLASVGDDDAVLALLGALGHDHAYPVRLAAMDRLAARGPASVPALAALALDAGKPVPARRNAIRALGRTKAAEARAPILEALASEDAGVRLSAVHASEDLAKALGPAPAGGAK